jgi:hypothetical protein
MSWKFMKAIDIIYLINIIFLFLNYVYIHGTGILSGTLTKTELTTLLGVGKGISFFCKHKLVHALKGGQCLG